MKLSSLGGRNLLELKSVLEQPRSERLHIEDVDLKGLSLRNFRLRDLYFANGSLEAADLTGAFLQGVEFEGTWVDSAISDSAELNDVIFYDVQGYGANFSHATLKEVRFLGSNLAQSDFRGARFERVVFSKEGQFRIWLCRRRRSIQCELIRKLGRCWHGLWWNFGRPWEYQFLQGEYLW